MTEAEVFQIPQCIIDRQEELNRLCEEHPVTIPVNDAAKFLGMAPESLRESISTGSCPFGLGWQKVAGGNRAYCIPTLVFYHCISPMMHLKVSQRTAEANNPKMGYIDKESGLW